MKIVCAFTEVEARIQKAYDGNVALKDCIFSDIDEGGNTRFIEMEGVRVIFPKYEIYMRRGHNLDFEESGEQKNGSDTIIYIYEMTETNMENYTSSQNGSFSKALSMFLHKKGLPIVDFEEVNCILDYETVGSINGQDK